jgi:hypothetical protein
MGADTVSSADTFWNIEVPEGTGAPGSPSAPVVPPSASAREGVGAGFGQASGQSQSPDGSNPQYSRPSPVTPGSGSDYSSTGAGMGRPVMPQPDAEGGA